MTACQVFGFAFYDTPMQRHQLSQGEFQDTDKVAMIFFGSGATKIELVELSAGEKVDHAQASGRFATETEDGAPAHIGNNVQEAGGTVLHGPVKLQVHPSDLALDVEHFVCLVTSDSSAPL